MKCACPRSRCTGFARVTGCLAPLPEHLDLITPPRFPLCALSSDAGEHSTWASAVSVAHVERIIVAERYVGRHRRAELAQTRVGSPSRRLGLAFRPMVHAGASIALASAAVGGYLTAGSGSAPVGAVLANPPVGSTTAPALGRLISIAPEQLTAFDATAADLEAGTANRERVTRAGVAAAANEAAAAAAAAEAARLEAERQAAAERAARDAQRASIVANAQKDPKAVAALMVADRGWNTAQFGCLVKLWTKESNWRWNATNRSSGAYGIPQSLPGSKMATAGADWRTNPVTQITWGLNYIAGRYGTPCGAWSHSVSHNWY